MSLPGDVRIVIRTDISPTIGSGHMMRCLTLADALVEKNGSVEFIARDHAPAMLSEVERGGYRLHRLASTPKKQDRTERGEYEAWLGVAQREDAEQTIAVLKQERLIPDWIIVDHYALDRTWESMLRGHVGQIMVIDDLANRSHDCDLLLDQNLYESPETRYAGLIPENCTRLLGPSYALLRPEFAKTRKLMRTRDGSIRDLLIFFGASDLPNMTGRTLQALNSAEFSEITLHVVIGLSNPHAEMLVRQAGERANIKFYPPGQSMHELMSEMDLAIGGAGTTTWERCCLGLPSILVVLAENQAEIARVADKSGIAISLGNHVQITTDRIADAVRRFSSDRQFPLAMSERSGKVVDGLGRERVAERILSSIPASAS